MTDLTFFQENLFLTYAVPLGGLALLLIAGFLSLRKNLVELYNDEDFVHEFRENFISYCNSRGEDNNAYTYLMLNSSRMQRNMGPMGVYGSFRPPSANYPVSNYPIILNMIPEIRSFIDRENEHGFGLFASTIDGYIKAVDEALLRYIGNLKDRSSQALNSLKNPFLWFQTGMGLLLSLPLMIFVSFGLMAGSTLRALQSNYIFKCLNALLSIIALVSGLMTIILGWDQVTSLLEKFYINWFPTRMVS